MKRNSYQLNTTITIYKRTAGDEKEEIDCQACELPVKENVHKSQCGGVKRVCFLELMLGRLILFVY